jgi:hypothetical protein
LHSRLIRSGSFCSRLFLSGFTAIADRLNNIKELQLLIGNTSNCETIEQIAQGYRRLELISDRIEAQIYPKRTESKQMVTVNFYRVAIAGIITLLRKEIT